MTLITSSDNNAADEHNDVVIPLFDQLKLCPVPLFKEAIEKWHREYLEAQLPPLMLPQQKQELEKLVQHLVAHVSYLSSRAHTPYYPNQTNPNAGTKHNLDGLKPKPNFPPWMIMPPAHPAETKLVDRKLYTWCTKCHQGQGLWVCHHNTPCGWLHPSM